MYTAFFIIVKNRNNINVFQLMNEKYYVVQSHNRISFNNKGQKTNTWYNMDEPENTMPSKRK